MKVKPFLILFVLLTSCKTLTVNETEKNYLLSGSGENKFYLVNLIRQKQAEGILGEKPMLIINSDIIFYHSKKDIQKIKINKSEIKGLKITKAEKCVSLYGAACKYGLLEINTYRVLNNKTTANSQ